MMFECLRFADENRNAALTKSVAKRQAFLGMIGDEEI